MLSVLQVIENRQEENKNKKIMSKIVKLTEADLTRIVRRVIQENEENSEESFDFSQTNNKLLRDLFTAKHGFKYVDNVNGMEIYSLPRRGFTIMVAIKPANNHLMWDLQSTLNSQWEKVLTIYRKLKVWVV